MGTIFNGLAIMLFMLFYIFVYYPTWQNESRLEKEKEKLDELTKKQDAELRELRAKLNIIEEQQQKEKDVSLIQKDFHCSYKEAVSKYNLLKETQFLIEFKYAEDKSEKIQVYEKAENFFKDCQNIYLPYARKKGLNLNIDMLGRRIECFEEPLYNDIDYKDKLEMINACDNNIVKQNPNLTYLTNLIEERNLFPDIHIYEVGITSADGNKLASLFIDHFGMTISTSELAEISARSQLLKHLGDDFIIDVFCMCVYYSMSFDEENGIYRSDDLRYYIRSLFFGVIYHDLKSNWKEAVINHLNDW